MRRKTIFLQELMTDNSKNGIEDIYLKQMRKKKIKLRLLLLMLRIMISLEGSMIILILNQVMTL